MTRGAIRLSPSPDLRPYVLNRDALSRAKNPRHADYAQPSGNKDGQDI